MAALSRGDILKNGQFLCCYAAYFPVILSPQLIIPTKCLITIWLTKSEMPCLRESRQNVMKPSTLYTFYLYDTWVTGWSCPNTTNLPKPSHCQPLPTPHTATPPLPSLLFIDRNDIYTRNLCHKSQLLRYDWR